MQKLKYFFFFLILAIPAFAQSTLWKFDQAHSQVQFTVTHLIISEVTGNFKKFDGEVKSNSDDFTNSYINFTIDVNSINTDNEKRDAHLKSDDFFNAEKFPRIIFNGKSMKKIGDTKYKLLGHITIRDVTKQIELEITQSEIVKAWGQERIAFKIQGTLNRFDFNLKWNNLIETGGAVVGKEVVITCNVQLIKQTQS